MDLSLLLIRLCRFEGLPPLWINLVIPSLRTLLSFFIMVMTAIISWFYWTRSLVSIVVSTLCVSRSKLPGSPSRFGFIVEYLKMFYSWSILSFLSNKSSPYFSISNPLFRPRGSGDPPCVRASCSILSLGSPFWSYPKFSLTFFMFSSPFFYSIELSLVS